MTHQQSLTTPIDDSTFNPDANLPSTCQNHLAEIETFTPGKYDRAMQGIGALAILSVLIDGDETLKEKLLGLISEIGERVAQRKSKRIIPENLPETIILSHKVQGLVQHIKSEPLESTLSSLDESLPLSSKTIRAHLLELSRAIGIDTSFTLRSQYLALIGIFKSDDAPKIEFKFDIFWELVPKDLRLSPTYERFIDLILSTPDEKTFRTQLNIPSSEVTPKLQKIKQVLGQNRSPETPYDVIKLIFSSDKKPNIEYAIDISNESIPEKISLPQEYEKLISLFRESSDENEFNQRCNAENISNRSRGIRVRILVDKLGQTNSTESPFVIIKSILNSECPPHITYEEEVHSKAFRRSSGYDRTGNRIGLTAITDEDGSKERRFYGLSGNYFKPPLTVSQIQPLRTDVRRAHRLTELGYSIPKECDFGTSGFRSKLDAIMIEAFQGDNPRAREWVTSEYHDFFLSILPLTPAFFIQLAKHVEDVNSIVYTAVVRCLHEFSPEKETTLNSYIFSKISFLFLEQRRVDDFVPRSIRDRQKQILGLEESSPSISPEEVMQLLDISSLQYNEAIHAQESPRSLHTPTYSDPGDNHIVELLEILPADADVFSDVLKNIRSDALLVALQRLKESHEREYRVLVYYYLNEETFKEIGGILGISESRVYQLHGQAISRLRQYLESYFSDNHKSPSLVAEEVESNEADQNLTTESTSQEDLHS